MKCSKCQGRLIGSELAFGTCGDCGGRWLLHGRLRGVGPRLEPEPDVITVAVTELLEGADLQPPRGRR